MKTWAAFEDHELRFCGLKFPIAKLKGFSFKPVARKNVELTFSASIRSPSDQQINVLADMLHSDSALEVIAPPDLFDGIQPSEGMAAAAGKKQVTLSLVDNEDALYPKAEQPGRY